MMGKRNSYYFKSLFFFSVQRTRLGPNSGPGPKMYGPGFSSGPIRARELGADGPGFGLDPRYMHVPRLSSGPSWGLFDFQPHLIQSEAMKSVIFYSFLRAMSTNEFLFLSKKRKYLSIKFDNQKFSKTHISKKNVLFSP